MEDQANSASPFVVIPFIPPTSNNIYVTDWKRRVRFLSKEADAFKKRVITMVGQEKAAEITSLNREAVYRIWLNFYFDKDELLNKTFGSGKKDAASTRYKRMDVENRVKLVVDAFSKAVAIDDCQFFEGGHTKLCADMVGGTPQIHVFFHQAEPGRFGL